MAKILNAKFVCDEHLYIYVTGKCYTYQREKAFQYADNNGEDSIYVYKKNNIVLVHGRREEREDCVGWFARSGLSWEYIPYTENKEKEKKIMKKLFVSVPMKNRTEENIRKSIAKMKAIAEAYEGEELELIESYIEDKPPKSNHQAVWYLGKSLEKLSQADVFIGIYDCYGDHYVGCEIEKRVARGYNIKSYEIDINIIAHDVWEKRQEENKKYAVPVINVEG